MRVKKCLSILLTLVMVLSLLPTTALAADRGTVKVPYIDDLGREASADATPLTGSETELGTGFYAVTDNVIFNHPVTVTGSATRIILCDGKTAAFSSISTTGNCQLRFYGQKEGSGSLTATNLTGGLISIYGGTISADTMTATPLNMFDGTLSANALTVGWYADFTMSSHFFGGIVDVDTLTVQDHDFTIGTENTPSPTDSFCAGSYVIAQGLKLHFANTFTAAEPDGNGAYIRYSGDYDNSAAAALNGKTLRPYITHTVNWVVEGETKETDTVLSGSPASYDGATPTKPDEQGKKYIFSGWSDGTNTYAPDALPPVTADVTYTAVFVAGHGIKAWSMYINPDMLNDPSSTVTPSVDSAAAGETVTLTVNAAPKEKLTEQQSYSANSSSSVTLTNGFFVYSSSENISIEKNGDSYSFVMPDAEVTIIAFFDYFNYSITVNEPIHGHMDVYKLNGNEMTAVTAADEGDEIHVRLAANPDDLYIVTGMTYTYTENGVNKTGEISLTNEINQLYLGTFTMPASDVVINITDQAAHRIIYKSSALKQDYFSETTGQTVTLTPENGYTVTRAYVKCGDEYITVTANADGTFSFMMPNGDVTVFTEFPYIDLDGSAKTSTPTIIAGDMTDLNTGWYAVDGNITNNNRISVNGDVNLILCDGATLTAPKGISVNSGNSLTIWGQTAGSGALTAMIDENDEDLYYLAAIGGYQTSSGSITINGGTVTAKGGVMAAGIGGGRQGDGTVVINGGTVTARGGNWGAGIGGGQRSDSNGGHGNVTITGGTVTATGGAKSAGIGGGYNFDNKGTAGATAVISGGVVNAIGGVGIGGSADDSSISLGWKDFDHDSIKADSYAGMVTLTKDFTDGTNGYAAGAVEDNTVLAGKTLIPAVLHTVTVSTDENGTVTAPGVAAEGETVTLTVTPDKGYMLSTLTVKQDGTEVKTTVGENNTYTFVMPAGDVTVTATFEEAKYVISTVFKDENGSIMEVDDYRVTVDDIEADTNDNGEYVSGLGKSVVLSFNTPAGYELAGVAGIYLDESQNECSLPMTQDATDPSSWSFTMPDGDTVLTVTFRKLPVYSITIEPSEKGVVTVQPEVSTDGTAYAGEKVYVTAYPEDGITLSRVYYSGEGHADVVIPQNDDGYSFIMPDYDVTIHADFEAYYMVHVDFGTGHEDYAIDNFAGKTLPFGDESQVFEVSGSVVSFQYVPEDGGGDHIFNAKSVAEELLNALSDRNDNGERLMGQIALHQIEYYFENYAYAPYNAQSPEEAANGEYSEDSYREGVTFYALWAKPAEVTLTVTPPACGTIVQYQYKTGSYVWVQPGPQLSVTGADFRDYQFFYTNWELSEYGISGIADGPLTMTGGNSYKAHCYLDTDWGYFLDSSTAEEPITVEGGTLVSCDTDGKVVISVPVEHSYGEDGICTGCGAKKVTEPEFKTQSLLLSGKIGVVFYMDLPTIEGIDYSSSYMTFGIPHGTCTSRADFDSNNKNRSETYYGFTCFINSVQMAEEITATFHYTENGEDKTVEKVYVPSAYFTSFDSVVTEGTVTDQATIDVVHALADFGHYVQPFLAEARHWTLGTDYAVMEKQYSESSDYNYADILSAVSSNAIKKNGTDSDIEKITNSLTLDSDTVINVYFKPADGYSGSFTASIDGGTSQTYTPGTDGRYCVQISGISAHELSKDHTITVMIEGGQVTVTVSALSYVYSALSYYNDTNDADRKARNAVSAVYAYSKAADTYKTTH